MKKLHHEAQANVRLLRSPDCEGQMSLKDEFKETGHWPWETNTRVITRPPVTRLGDWLPECVLELLRLPDSADHSKSC